ncbi:MAG TPA: hypothetical protein VGF61_19670 [Candidatus Acidoferrum sp.]
MPAASASAPGGAIPGAQNQTTRNPHGPLTIPCENCHTATGWRPIKAAPEFDHNKTAYPLRGMHEKVACTLCHVKPVFTNVGKNCADCHADIHRRQFGPNCAQCHTVQGWDVATQKLKDHQNRFPLLGAHAAVDCSECHKGAATGVYFGLSTQCDSCHLKDWQNTTNPPHKSNPSVFPASNCQGCHSFDSWLGAKFDHSTTGFQLTNGHANVPCASCHINNNYNLQIAPTDCGHSGCHLSTWQQTTNPPHPKAGPAFAASNCVTCHSSTVSWSIVTFDHSSTGFQLTNGHANVPCASCHINNNYTLTIAPTDCGNSGCHLTKWQQTTTPVHASSGPAFGAANCANCHTPKGWDAASFDHSITGWPLTGAHASAQCALCHVNNNYSLTSANTDCYGCHQTQWNSTQNMGGNVPNHVVRSFPPSLCSQCHNTTDWAQSTFDHSITGFPLQNLHKNVADGGKVAGCVSCHIANNYGLTIQPNDCGNAGCHLSTWQQATNPVHATSGPAFAAANCSGCHSTMGWGGANFDHATTGFALVGTHATTPCASCHVNNNYTLKTADCLSCHTADWNKTQTLGGNVPNHVASNFPSTAAACSTCHTITTWADGKFDHSTTGFPLQNSHQMSPAGKVTACTRCHIGGNYNLAIQPTDCGNSGCHLSTWQQTNNPAHPAGGAQFAVANCSACHNTIAWTDVTSFNHAATGFALVGTHMSPNPTPCASCHVNNNYTLSSTDCMGCHQTAWNSTQTLGGNVPNHVAANFPTSASSCATCHTITTWANGKFDHSTTGFPLQNSHQMSPAGKVTACTQCHISGNYNLSIQPTDCGNSGCHLTTWQQTNNPTHSTAGSAFATANCSTCHDTITWTDNTFNHAVTGWALSGAHTTTPCASCHLNNNYNFPSANTDCYGCHKDKYNGTAAMGGNVPNHVAAAFPTSQCSSCHTTTNWTSTWSHSSTGFALTGTHATTPCASCHVNNNYSLTAANADCMGCHLAAWNTTQTLGGNVPNHVASNFPTTAAACSGCHTITVWADGKFDHSTTGFTLTGAHQMAPAGKVTSCTQCHINGNYTLTAANTACYGCHLADWNSTQTLGGAVPNHVAAAFPTTCDTCHTTTSWLGATFNHTWFQIPHGNEPNNPPCNDCHQVQTNFASFTCINCHTDTNAHRPGMQHPNVSGYVYNATSCYGCHKGGGN